MPIAITPEHNDLAGSVRSLVARVAPSEVLHAALEAPIPNPPPYWKAAAEQGLQGVHLAESVGGQGFGILELAIVIAEFGYGAVPGPFVPSAIASALIAAHDPDAKLLNDIASGNVIAAYAIDSGLTATRQGDDLVIRGEVRAVPAAMQASVLVLPVAIDSGEEWVVLDADQLEIEPVKSVDPLRPLAHVRANAVEVGDDRVLSNLSRTLARALMSTLLSAESIGVARWATDTASAYAKIREQFGRPIGQFQAIKHKCAEMIADTERATAAVWDAARAIDESHESDTESASADSSVVISARACVRLRLLSTRSSPTSTALARTCASGRSGSTLTTGSISSWSASSTTHSSPLSMATGSTRTDACAAAGTARTSPRMTSSSPCRVAVSPESIA